MEVKNLNMKVLQDLWKIDCDEQNLKKMKKDDISEIIEAKKLKSKCYLQQNLFKIFGGGFAYFENDNLVCQNRIKNLREMIPVPLWVWFKSNPVAYKKHSNPNCQTIDHAKLLINTHEKSTQKTNIKIVSEHPKDLVIEMLRGRIKELENQLLLER